MLEQLYGKELTASESTPSTSVTPTPHAPFHNPDEEQAYQQYKRSRRDEFLKTHKP
jgi:hypothetical protein